MKWDRPRYVEIKMDAEIGSYQEDPDFPEFAAPVSRPAPGCGAACDPQPLPCQR
jgi:hypothetical protein